MDFSAFDERDESILLWHCGPSSKKFCQKNGYKLSHNFSGMAHETGKVNGTGIVRDMEFDAGKASVFRFSGDMESYINVTGDFIGNTKESNNRLGRHERRARIWTCGNGSVVRACYDRRKIRG